MLAPWWQPDVVDVLAGFVVSAVAVAEGSARAISAKASVKRLMGESYADPRRDANRPPAVRPQRPLDAAICASSGTALHGCRQVGEGDHEHRMARVTFAADRPPNEPAGICDRCPDRRQFGYSSFRHARGSAGWAFGVRSSRKLEYGATNGSGAITV